MPTPIDTPTLRFRRAASLAAVAGLLCFAWVIWMLLHFNAGSASIRFGARTMLGIATITLPGPLLLLFLCWQARYRFCRVVGWVAILPVLAVGVLPAYYAAIKLRPPLSPASYDAAVREAESGMLTAAIGSNPSLALLKDIRAEFAQHPQTKDAYASLYQQTRLVREQLEAHAAQFPGGIRAVMTKPFDDRAISPARRDEYLRMIFQRLDPDEASRLDEKILKFVRLFEVRLKMLTDYWGKWHWASETQPRFDDNELNTAYDVLLDGEPAP